MDGQENQTPVEQAPVSNEPVQETHTESPKIGLRVDERTGRRIIETVHEEPKEEPQETPQIIQNAEQQSQEQPQVQPQQVQPQVPPQSNYYSPSEMTLALQMGQVDPNRVPPEYAPQYAAMVAKDATKPKSESELRNEFLDSVNKMAKEKSMKDLGLTQDELDMGEFSDDEEIRNKVDRYKAQLEINRTNIINEYAEQMRIENIKAQQANEFKQGVAKWIQGQRAQEPHFDDIGRFMETAYKIMPYEQAATIAPAVQKAMAGQLDPQSAQIVQQYYEQCRKEYYAKLNGTSTTPTPRSPSVERRGTGKAGDEPVDFAERLRNASVRDKAAIVGEWLNAMKR
nr:MAG TPA: hypothetical protein [Caudoviricetes sp.]